LRLVAGILLLLAVFAAACIVLALVIVFNGRNRPRDAAAVSVSHPAAPRTATAGGQPPGGFPAGAEPRAAMLAYQGYTSCFSPETRTPVWVGYRLFANDNPDPPRPNADFKSDPRAPVLVASSNYTNSGFDRGHMAPSDAIGKCYGVAAQIETFMTTNICPQDPGLNQRCWERFEQKTLHGYAEAFGEVWVIDGPIFDGPCLRLASGVAVPAAFFKIVLARTKAGPGGKLEALAIVMNNERTERSRVADYATTIRTVEFRTGLDFEPGLDDAEENALETALPSDPRWGLNDALDPEFPGESRTRNVLRCQ
jgi:endonuclease G